MLNIDIKKKMDGQTRSLIILNEQKGEETFLERLGRQDREIEKKRIEEDIKKHEIMSELAGKKLHNKSFSQLDKEAEVKANLEMQIREQPKIQIELLTKE